MTITSVDLSLIQSLNSGSSSSDIMSILYGASTTSSIDPITALQNAEINEKKDVTQQANDPQTKRDVDHFLSVVASAKDVTTVLDDPTARKVLLTANGLGDQTDYTALAVRALTSDTTKTGNLASTLSDSRWLTMAKTYDFANQGLTVLKTSTVLSTVASGYAEVKWRESLDSSTPGLSAALDFRSRASTIKSADAILGDSNIRKVVTTALGIPEQIAYQPLEAQEQAITSRLDITKFQDPKFVEQFARRFLIANQSTATSSSATIYYA